MPDLSNIREFLGWAIGARIVDVTADDPPALPDSEADEGSFVVLHFDNGGTITFPVDDGFHMFEPGEKD